MRIAIKRQKKPVDRGPCWEEELALRPHEFMELWRQRILTADGYLRPGVHVARLATALAHLRNERP